LPRKLAKANEKLALENAYLRDTAWRAKLIARARRCRRSRPDRTRCPVPTTVLIEGETGTGKDLVAHAIHDASPRREKTFFAINCAEIPKELQESQPLRPSARVVHRRRSPTARGSSSSRTGSTLFLDEITETSHEFQAKLLRVIQGTGDPADRESRPRKVDFRLIIATNAT